MGTVKITVRHRCACGDSFGPGILPLARVNVYRATVQRTRLVVASAGRGTSQAPGKMFPRT